MLLAAGGTVAAFLQNNAVRLIKTYFFPSGTRISPFVGTELYSIHDVISQPFKIALVFINTIFTEGSRLIYEILGGKMGSLQDIQMPWMYELVFLLVIIFILPYGAFKLKSRVSTVICMICAIGSAGIPMSAMVMMAIILSAVGLPVEGIGLVIGVDRILDMLRTSVNVYGDTCVAVLVAKSEGEHLPIDVPQK
jgi:hypothetical protein